MRAFRSRTASAILTGGSAPSALPLRHRLLGTRKLADVLAAKCVLVTGASSGIGRAVALDAARAGATAVLVARSKDALDELKTEIERIGGSARVYPADLSSADSAKALLRRLHEDGVRVDVLVNSAGRSIRRAVEDSCDRLHDFERTMALNYFGALRLILGLLPGMRARGRGHVINVSSVGVEVGTPLFSAYVASKAALDAFTRVAAGEVDDECVRFTTVHMPLVRTPMIAPTEAYHDVPAWSPEEASSQVLRAVITEERVIGTRLSVLFSVGHALAPNAVRDLLNIGHHTAAAREPHRDEPRLEDGRLFLRASAVSR